MATAAEPLSQTASSLRFDVETREHDDGLSAFANVRPRLFGIAYRMLGSAAEAEDIVQDVWLLWQSANRGVVENPPAFLATTTTRLCINLAQSARSRRETYIGAWFPEPVDTSADPGLGAELGEGLRLAVLVLLEKLSPTERAAYILREAFDYSYRQIADILQMEEANTRQLVSRARKRIADGRRTPVSPGEQRRLLEAFIAAAQKGDMAALEGLFAEDVVSCAAGSARRLLDAHWRRCGSNAGVGAWMVSACWMVTWQRSQRHVRWGCGCQVTINYLDPWVRLLELGHDRSRELAALRVAA